MNIREFYLSSHDFGTDPRPRKCEVMRYVEGLRPNSEYLLVKIAPPVTTRFWDGPITDFDHIFLAFIANLTLQDIEKKQIMADIVICPTYSGGSLDERACSRIGVGSLHATYTEAFQNSPIEDK